MVTRRPMIRARATEQLDRCARIADANGDCPVFARSSTRALPRERDALHGEQPFARLAEGADVHVEGAEVAEAVACAAESYVARGVGAAELPIASGSVLLPREEPELYERKRS
jgi:hypothetical protein